MKSRAARNQQITKISSIVTSSTTRRQRIRVRTNAEDDGSRAAMPVLPRWRTGSLVCWRFKAAYQAVARGHEVDGGGGTEHSAE